MGSEDDYGDYVMKEREARKDDVIEEDADVEEGSDPIGDIFADILKGAGALLTEGIKIVTDATDGSKNVTEVVGGVLKVGTDATEEVAKIGVKAIGAAPSILEQKVALHKVLAKPFKKQADKSNR